MNVSPKEPITRKASTNGQASTGTNCSSALPEDAHPTGERAIEPPAASTSNKKPAPANDLLPPIIPQKDVEDGGIAPPRKRSDERMLHNMAMVAVDRVSASANPREGLGFGTSVTTTTTRLPYTELQMREEMLLLQEQQRLVEQEMLQQRLLIAEQRHREGMELLALRGGGPSAAGASVRLNTTPAEALQRQLNTTPAEALQRQLLKVEAEEARLNRHHHNQQQQQQQHQQQLAESNASLLRLQRELALAEKAHAAEVVLRVRAERARQVREALTLTSHQPHQVHQLVVRPTTATAGLQCPPNTATASAIYPPSPHPANMATAISKKTTKRASAVGGTKKKRKVGRPIGSSAKAKERSKQLADASHLFQTESLLLDMSGLCPSDDFTMSPEMAASILEASTSGAGSARPITANTTGAANTYPTATGITATHANCWVDPTPNSTSRSTFILPCSRQPGALLQAPSLDSYRSQWSAIQSSLTNDTRLSPISRQKESLDQFLHDARFAGVPIQNDTSIAGRYGVNSKVQVLQRMEVGGHIAHRVGFGIGSQQHQQQEQARIAASAIQPTPPTQQRTVVVPKQQAEPQKQQCQGKSQPSSASESKVSEYLTSTPNMMMLPLQQRSSLPRMA